MNSVLPIPEDTPLYLVIRADDNLVENVFFDRLELAILWALVTRKELTPIPIGLADQNPHLYEHRIQGEFVPDYLFPAPDSFILMRYATIKDLTFHTKPLTEAQFASPNFIQRQENSMYVIKDRSPYFTTNFIVYDPDSVALGQPEIDYDATFGNMIMLSLDHERKLQDIMQIRDPGLRNNEMDQLGSGIQMNIFRFSDPSVVEKTSKDNINWELVWMEFLRVRSISNTFAYYTVPDSRTSFTITTAMLYMDEELAAASDEEFVVSADEEIVAERIVAEATEEEYGLCNEGIIGFNNPHKTSCFMDSTLMAMFALKFNPFYPNLIDKDLILDPNSPDYTSVCNNTPAQDIKLRGMIQGALRLDITRIMGGDVFACSLLRKLLGKDCRVGDWQEDLSLGTHDPSELYTRLMGALNYSPIKYRENRYVSNNAAGTDEELVYSKVIDDNMLSPLAASDPTLNRISWPATWNADYNFFVNSRGAQQYTKTAITILKADCIVVHLDRRKHRYGVGANTGGSMFNEKSLESQNLSLEELMKSLTTTEKQTTAEKQTTEKTATSLSGRQREESKFALKDILGRSPPLLTLIPPKQKEEATSEPMLEENRALTTAEDEDDLEYLMATFPDIRKTGEDFPSSSARLDTSLDVKSLLSTSPPTTTFLPPPTFKLGPIKEQRPRNPKTNYAPFQVSEEYKELEAQINAHAVNDRAIEVDQIFLVNGLEYMLRAVVFSPVDAHFATLLKCGTSWFEYNDLYVNKTISRNKVSNQYAEHMVKTRAVMFFYYPSPEDEEIRLLIEQGIQ